MPAKKKNVKKRPKRKMVAGNKKKSAGQKQTAKRAVQRGKRRLSSSPSRKKFQARAGAQSGDLQGLSTRERADSESVDELLEEGNVFEAGVVKGVEEAEDADEKEVHSHEVPEDDVPGEYLDKDN